MEIGTAHQKKIRDKKAVEEAPNPYWESLNRDISNAVVKPVERAIAKSIIEEYEWLGCMAAITKYCFGIFYDGVCAGVVCYGTEYSENLGIWEKYGYKGRMLLLNRGVCLHWAHPHSGSKLIMESIKQLPDKYDVITATTDPAAGEVGTIYQACNFYYIGSMREQNPNIKNKKPKSRFGVIIDGKVYSARAMRAKVGSQRKDAILAKYPQAEFIKQYNKHRYFYYRGSKSNKRWLRNQMKDKFLPYPKRILP